MPWSLEGVRKELETSRKKRGSFAGDLQRQELRRDALYKQGVIPTETEKDIIDLIVELDKLDEYIEKLETIERDLLNP